MMEKLRKVIIYKIKGVNYIGSTTCLFKRQLSHSVSCCNKSKQRSVYKHIVKHKLQIVLEPLAYLFVGKRGGEMVEQSFINKYNSIKNGFNMKNAYGWDFKRHKQNKKKYEKKREETTKVKAYRREYKKRERAKQLAALQYQKHKVKINARRSQKIKCLNCFSIIRRDSISRHKRSKKCLNYNIAV